jgi:hypothetical protein
MKSMDEKAVSEVIGVVLLISVTVLGVALVAVTYFSQPAPSEIPHVSVVAGATADNATFILSHEGGDALAEGSYRIYVETESGLEDQTDKFALEGDDDVWSIGENLTYKGTPGRVVISVVDSGGGEMMIAEPAYVAGAVDAGGYVDEGGSGTMPAAAPPATPGEGPFVKNKDGVSLFEEVNFYPGKNQDLNNLTFSGNGGNDVATLEANFTLQNVDRVDFLLYPLKKPPGNDEKKVEINRSIVNGSDGNYTWDVKKSALNPVNNGDKYVMILIAYNSTDHVIGVSARVVPVIGLK